MESWISRQGRLRKPGTGDAKAVVPAGGMDYTQGMEDTPNKNRVVMARLVRLENDDGGFDQEFWSKVGDEGRFAAMWEMVEELNAIRGDDASQPRLRRSVQNIQRI